MKCVILAGGFGTRISEYTLDRPKPMIEVGGIPIILHIIRWYAKFGVNDFIISCGYRGDFIKDYFSNYYLKTSDFSVSLQSNEITINKKSSDCFNITLVDTGQSTLTGGRIKAVAEYLDDKPFFATYGDGLSNVNITELYKFHKNHGKIGTVTAVRPPARFGELVFDGDEVYAFKEKPQLNSGWINGGYFVFERAILDYIEDLETSLEEAPLEHLSRDNELMAFKHADFWQCMDTKRDHDYLNKLVKEGAAPWL